MTSKEIITLIEIFTLIPGYGNQTDPVLILLELPDPFKVKPEQVHEIFS